MSSLRAGVFGGSIVGGTIGSGGSRIVIGSSCTVFIIVSYILALVTNAHVAHPRPASITRYAAVTQDSLSIDSRPEQVEDCIPRI